MKPIEHNIKSLEDFLAVVNEENCDMLCGNFYGMIRQFVQMRKKNPGIKFKGFTWIDDGELEIRKAKVHMHVDAPIGNLKDNWLRVNAIPKYENTHRFYSSKQWICSDGDSVEIEINLESKEFDLYCFSGITGASHINIQDVDFSCFRHLWKDSSDDVKIEFEDFCFMIAEHLCEKFCEKVVDLETLKKEIYEKYRDHELFNGAGITAVDNKAALITYWKFGAEEHIKTLPTAYKEIDLVHKVIGDIKQFEI